MSKAQEEGKEVAVSEGMAVAELGDLFNIRENMEGVVPDFPVIKSIHQGQMFEMPDGQKVESFTGIIIDISRANAFWHESFDTGGGGHIPDCFSVDGLVPSHNSADKQSDDCATCPQNQFGSDRDGGRGKACKNMKRIFVLLPGEQFPFRLIASPANIRSIDSYVTQLSSKAIPYQLVVTEFSLYKKKNQDNIEFSGMNFKHIETIEDKDAAMKIKRTVDDLRASMRGLDVSAAEVG